VENLARGPGAKEPNIGLLDHIVAVGERGEAKTKIGAERGFVGMHFLREPASAVGF